ncbi:HpcH/HpaI aldolase family protein [Halorarum salinum]|uniref:Aldolase n=1 Tax=Halorarum salinum TaxID=2743089 RepID=A0A7D5LA45_9EURY|nr:aldolase/citrate lyase family protein [Halobaculum salinum]QLG61567.1 aldolase [Halobaculum salinum]
MADTIRETLREDSPAGSWLSIPSAQVAEQTAAADFDFVVIDTEHASTDVGTVESMVRAVDAAEGETAPLVRVAWNDHVRIKRVLDTGAAGVMAPQVDTAAEAEAFVEATRYPPEGRRGVAAARASNYVREFEEYYGSANDAIATVAQVESAEAVGNAADVAAVDGLDSLFVGPADLSAALGAFGEYESEPFLDAVGTVLSESSVPVGTLATSPEEVDHWADVGFDYQIVGTDMGYLARGAAESLARYR